MIFTYEQIVVLFPCLFLIAGSIILSLKTGFIQIRAIPRMFSLLRSSLMHPEHHKHTIAPHRALFTAMTTTIGIGNIVGPLIAIGLGGPGAMLGYALATLFGSAATFTEVTFAQNFKDPDAENRIGGPMYYLNKVFHPSISYLYALSALILVTVWSGAQSNVLAAMLEPYAIPPAVTGGVLTIATLFLLFGGIERVSAAAEKMVPVMFFLYSGAMSWILICNSAQFFPTLGLIWKSAFTSSALSGGFAGAGLAQALRWGLAKGINSNESGLGTATVSHSMADAESAVDQGILSVISVFSNGILCFLSGMAVLMTGYYKEYGVDNVTLLTRLFSEYFPVVGPAILLMSATLFVFSTILGNSYNGSQYFLYTTGKWGKKSISLYYALCALGIFCGSSFSVNAVWTFEDYLVLPLIFPHIIGIIILAFRYPDVLQPKNK